MAQKKKKQFYKVALLSQLSIYYQNAVRKLSVNNEHPFLQETPTIKVFPEALSVALSNDSWFFEDKTFSVAGDRTRGKSID